MNTKINCWLVCYYLRYDYKVKVFDNIEQANKYYLRVKNSRYNYKEITLKHKII